VFTPEVAVVGPFSKTAAQRDAMERAALEQARREFPDWDIRPAFPGWEAVPKGTPVIRSADLEGVLEKLRRHAGTETGQEPGSTPA
jgi:hypothetical protein